ncbi:iron complex outermembrane receptor protein [Pseudoxanthomonas japonensis]|uniref:TonB-dependent receptor n=1 Tax=Pseudoxanthomonas japonensis TaxID=69284 RepID=UPI001A494FCC|nr:TonB-dependent receptor [Pseudoxanthomonas japonensis]MBA3930060.1 TonB-dependent receptor [Xanthomonas sp.]MBL8256567.1 TonB-dependent receptor [Pseudoxanthomonas mexicana]MDR7067859.1 iron complex outermembrane receptor protein [Pseudoxanthomonas japonensis]
MKCKTSKLRDAISLALVVSASTTGAAFAQEATTTLDKVEVTGSRIKRTDVETSQPVFSLSREDIQAQGLTSIGDVIQNLTSNGTALNTNYNNGGNGETRVSLRNLGAQRTLVLVNGRRWVAGTGLGGATDLNTIPTAAVERIEVLKDGASAIYGSDAIAGVVNVILRTDFDGAEANAYYGQFRQGDGTRESYDITIGSSGERFSSMFGASYVKENPVMAGDREISAVPVFGTGVAFGSSTTPNGRFALCSGVFAPGACSVDETRPNGTAGQFTYNPGSTPANWRNFSLANDIYNFAPDNYLVTPQERKSIFGQASFDITDNVRFTTTGTYNNRKSEQLLAAMPIVLGTGPGAGVQARTLSISPNSIYNPFGQTVSRIQRRAVETGGRSFRQNVDTFGFVGALEGNFELADRYFAWDVGYSYGRNDQNDTTDGLFNILALRNALGPSFRDGNGVARCGTAGNVLDGCVPLNLLGGVGSITPEMLAYSTFVAHDEYQYTMKQWFANLSGEIVELPGGMLAFAAGVERRSESGYDSPDALINSGNTTGNARTATSGKYSLSEVYLELSAPLLRDVFLAKELELSIASRFSDYDTFGNTLNSKFGFKWKPIEDLMVRGSWAEGFRAPSIAELYAGVADSFAPISDPCSTTFGGGYNVLTADQRARCHAQGVPVGGYDQGNSQIRISVGGNPNLQPETSTSKTLGLVWSPSFISGFDVSLDWWNIAIKNGVITRSGQFILDACIREANAQACSLYNRNANGAIDTLLSSGLNSAQIEAEGYDLTLNYRLPNTQWGSFSFNLDNSYYSSYEEDRDGDNRVGEYVDGANRWRIRSNLLARWELGDWGATYSGRFYSRQEEECPLYYNDYGFGELCSDAILGPGDDGGVDVVQPGSKNKIGGTTYHDISAYWKAPWNAKITLGVNNAFDKTPPTSYSTFANSFDPSYRINGRFFYMQYNQKF